MEPQLEQQQTQQEAQQEAQQEVLPRVEDWFECFFEFRMAREILVGQFESDGSRVWIHAREISSPGQHICFAVGTRMLVRIELNGPRNNNSNFKSNSKCRYRALECVVEGDFPKTLETGIVEAWNGNYGVIRRPCSCTIFAKSGFDNLPLEVGEAVNFSVEFNQFKGKCIAQHIKPTRRKEDAA